MTISEFDAEKPLFLIPKFEKKAMLKEERQKLILEKLKTDKKITFVKLSQLLHVSYDSIRRDVIELEDKGLLKKVHGGVIANTYLSVLNQPNTEMVGNNELSIIFKKVHKLIENKPLILMDGGTTNFFMAEQFPKSMEATIITNSPPLAIVLNDHPKIDVILLGGTYFKHYQITMGAEVIRQIENLRPDVYFMGVNGIDPKQGLTIRHYEESLMKQKMMQASKKTVCCVIEEKFKVQESYKVCNFDDIDYLITNLKPTEAALADFQHQGVEIW